MSSFFGVRGNNIRSILGKLSTFLRVIPHTNFLGTPIIANIYFINSSKFFAQIDGIQHGVSYIYIYIVNGGVKDRLPEDILLSIRSHQSLHYSHNFSYCTHDSTAVPVLNPFNYTCTAISYIKKKHNNIILIE